MCLDLVRKCESLGFCSWSIGVWQCVCLMNSWESVKGLVEWPHVFIFYLLSFQWVQYRKSRTCYHYFAYQLQHRRIQFTHTTPFCGYCNWTYKWKTMINNTAKRIIVIIIIIINNFCIALFSGVPKLTALYNILQHFLSFTNIIHVIMTTNNV